MCSTRVFAVTGPSGSLSPAGSSAASLTSTCVTAPVVDDEHEPLAARAAEHAHRAGVVEHHADPRA